MRFFKHYFIENENKQIYTDEFKNWFGDWEKSSNESSMVVDKQGMPLVVYHGTDKKFDKFIVKNGSWFITNKDEALEYGTNILSCYLNIRNLYVGSHEENAKYGIKVLINKIKSKNFDGILLPKDQEFFDKHIYYEAQHDVFIVFEPNQIKSATNNKGIFDIDNNNIYEDV